MSNKSPEEHFVNCIKDHLSEAISTPSNDNDDDNLTTRITLSLSHKISVFTQFMDKINISPYHSCMVRFELNSISQHGYNIKDVSQHEKVVRNNKIHI